jgi:hypothetical protein
MRPARQFDMAIAATAAVVMVMAIRGTATVTTRRQ